MEPVKNDLWQPIESLGQPKVFHQLDYAVREQVKKHITRHLHNHIDQFIQHGLTYEQLKEMQRELELCPSVLDLFPKEKESSLKRSMRVMTNWWRRLNYRFRF